MGRGAAYDARAQHSNTSIVSVKASPGGATGSRSSTARARCQASVNSAEDHSVGGKSGWSSPARRRTFDVTEFAAVTV